MLPGDHMQAGDGVSHIAMTEVQLAPDPIADTNITFPTHLSALALRILVQDAEGESGTIECTLPTCISAPWVVGALAKHRSALGEFLKAAVAVDLVSIQAVETTTVEIG